MKNRLPFRLPPRYQVPLPRLKKPHSLTNGYDALLASATDLVPEQLKAVGIVRATLAGKVKPHWIGTTLDSVHGPDALEQVVRDRYRNSIWEHLVPGSAVQPPYPSSMPSSTAGWSQISPVTIVTIHSQFLVDTAAELVATGLYAVRKATLDIGRDLDVPSGVKTQLRAIVGGPTIQRDMPSEEFRDQAFAWLERRVPVLQDGMNTELATEEVRKIVSMPVAPQIRLAASHQLDRILDIYTDLGLLVITGPPR